MDDDEFLNELDALLEVYLSSIIIGYTQLFVGFDFSINLN